MNTVLLLFWQGWTSFLVNGASYIINQGRWVGQDLQPRSAQLPRLPVYVLAHLLCCCTHAGLSWEMGLAGIGWFLWLYFVLRLDMTPKIESAVGGHIVLHLHQYSCQFIRHQRQCRRRTILKPVHPLAVCWHVDDRLDRVKSFLSFLNVFFLCRDSSSETEDAKVDEGIQERRREEENWQKNKGRDGEKKDSDRADYGWTEQTCECTQALCHFRSSQANWKANTFSLFSHMFQYTGVLFVKKKKARKTQIWAKSSHCVIPLKSLCKLGSKFQI